MEYSPASTDFRSDTITTPTKAMLAAMSDSTLGDDVYLEDKTTNDFQAEMAALLGKEAALFVSSGTMGNQLALRSLLTQPPHAILCDARAHIANYEAGGVATLSQAMLQLVLPKNGVYITLEDVQRVVVLSNDIHGCPTRVISLENTLGGTIIPLEEVKRISTFARAHGIKMHLDGARLWNAVAAGAGSLKEYAENFDSLTLCFSKGLGAPVGSILASTSALIAHARWIRKSIGGGMRNIGPIVNAARVAYRDNYPDALRRTHDQAARLEKAFAELGVKTTLPVQTGMLFLDLTGAGIQGSWLNEEAKSRGLKLGSGARVVIHHQITDESIEALIAAMKAVVDGIKDGKYVAAEQNGAADAGYGSLKRGY